MKKSFLLLTALLAALVMFVSCGEDPFFRVVTYLDNDGTTVLKTEGVLKGNKLSEYWPEKEGYDFIQWLTEDGEVYDPDTSVEEDIKLKAVWEKELAVGDTGPAGGKIFYVADKIQTSIYYDKDGKEVKYIWKYLEAAPSESTDFYYFGYYYKDGELASCGATAYAIGNGRMTTSLLVNAMGDKARISTKSTDTAVYAAKYADDYTYGGFDDWFLPSTHEIRQLYRSKTVTFNDGVFYMSSTEYSTNSESKICVNQAGTEKYVSRGTAYAYVWPIRAFYYRTK